MKRKSRHKEMITNDGSSHALGDTVIYITVRDLPQIKGLFPILTTSMNKQMYFTNQLAGTESYDGLTEDGVSWSE